MKWQPLLPLLLTMLLLGGCADSYRTSDASLDKGALPELPEDLIPGKKRTMTVTASAYNSLRGQTSGDPTIAAWGDKLRPGMKAIAVSRDLEKIGLNHGAKVRIDGLPGIYVVLDRMNKRWRKKIDIYMGTDRSRAMRWGKRKVEISWIEKRNVAANIRQAAPKT
ncbi:MAG: hypothetical protein ABFR19_01990 [Pseudomonadota bacterium]